MKTQVVGRIALFLTGGLTLIPATASASPINSVHPTTPFAATTGIAREFPGSAPAASLRVNVAPMANGCWHNGDEWMCRNVYYAPVYYGPSVDYAIVGYMISTTSSLGCVINDGEYVGGPHPYRWVWTIADIGIDGFQGKGWMRDIDIVSETNPLPLCND